MANVIKLKRGTSTPTTSDIANGEVALDTSAKKLYVNDSGTVKEIGGGGGITVQEEGSSLSTAATTLNFTGAYATATGSGATKNISVYAHSIGELTRGGTNAGSDGTASTFFGYAAGQNAASGAGGDRNTVFGANAFMLGSNNGNSNNVAVGWYALNVAQSGGNTAVGTSACQSLTTGGSNATFGSSAGKFLTTGADNLLAGSGSGHDITSGSYNTILGRKAGNSGTNDLTTGSNNILIGYNAAASSATVSNEITLGDANITKFRIPALNFIVKSSTATEGHVLTVDANGEAGFAAASSGGLSSDAQNNTVGGSNAGDSFSGTDAEDNTLLGYNAGTDITTGDSNQALGSEALLSLTTGFRNIALGYRALKSITTTGNNIGIGHASLQTGTGFEYTIALGSDAGGNQTGHHNIFMGNYTGRAATGNNNVAIGKNAFNPFGSGVSGADNVAIGIDAAGAITSGSNNTILGPDAGDALTTGSNNLILGHDAAASSATVSNEITLGDTNITKFRIPALGFSISASAVTNGGAFYENAKTVAANYTLSGSNAMAAGPITINSSVTVTVSSGDTLTII